MLGLGACGGGDDDDEPVLPCQDESCGRIAACIDTQWAPPANCTATDIAGKLRCIPGVRVTPRTDMALAGYQRFDLVFTQPVDHDQPDGAKLEQSVMLHHRSDTAPVVMVTGGYGMGDDSRLTELTRLLGANQIRYEHRYFEESRPAPADWSKLDIRQSARDAHRIAEALHWLYTGNWVNTGASKGGMTSVYHRRFHPCDVDATVAYVAPTSNSATDPRYNDFLASVGGAARVQCRADLMAFQRRLLQRRDEIVPMVQGTFAQISVEKAYEMAVIELNFAFWQYTDPRDPSFGCAAIPPDGVTTLQMLAFLESHVRIDDLAGEASLDYYHGYYHQAAAQLGAPAPYETPLADLLQFPGLDVPATFIPAGEVAAFDIAAMPDINQWVATEGEQMMFVYGELDPWSSNVFAASGKQTGTYYVAGGNHGASIGQLSAPDRTAALDQLRRWLNATVTVPQARSSQSLELKTVPFEERERWSR